LFRSLVGPLFSLQRSDMFIALTNIMRALL
jgi:hypothetical protein